MPLESGHKVAIWSIEDRGTYAKASISGAKKDKDGKYQTDWSNPFCTLFDKAYESVKGYNFTKEDNKRLDARIGWGYERHTENGKIYKQAPFSVTNNYDKAKATLYTNYAIYDLELIDSNRPQETVETTENTVCGNDNVTTEETKSQPTSNGLVGLDFLNFPDGLDSQLPFK